MTNNRVPWPTSKTLATHFANLERSEGSRAPIAMLALLQGHPHPNGATYLLVGVIQRAIIQRELDLWHARADDHIAHIMAHKDCCDTIRTTIATMQTT